MVRYGLLRILIFLGFLLVFWLVGLRDNPLLLVASAALASAALSYILLRGMRDEITARLVQRHEERDRARSEDETAEDAEEGPADAR